MCLGHFHKRACPTHGLFDGIANPAVTERDHYEGKKDKNSSSFAAFPNQCDGNQNKSWNKKSISANGRHQFIEKGIAQGAVDETENGKVNGNEPIHERFLNDGSNECANQYV